MYALLEICIIGNTKVDQLAATHSSGIIIIPIPASNIHNKWQSFFEFISQ